LKEIGVETMAKKYLCKITFPDFVFLINGKMTNFPGRNAGDKFSCLDIHQKPYKLLEKHSYVELIS